MVPAALGHALCAGRDQLGPGILEVCVSKATLDPGTLKRRTDLRKKHRLCDDGPRPDIEIRPRCLVQETVVATNSRGFRLECGFFNRLSIIKQGVVLCQAIFGSRSNKYIQMLLVG